MREYARIIPDPGRWHTRLFAQGSAGPTWESWQIRCQLDVVNVICTPMRRIPLLSLCRKANNTGHREAMKNPGRPIDFSGGYAIR